jgi:hypothetical protein
MAGPSPFTWTPVASISGKEIRFVTPGGETGVLTRGLNGFAAEPTVTCTYTGAVSGNAYTVVGFYPGN